MKELKEKYLYKKKKKNKESINVGFGYPYIYKFGMSVLGYLSLFKELDENPDVFAQRFFYDSRSLGIKPKHLDLFGFSSTFETDFVQIFKILKKYKIPILSKNRKQHHPLVFIGGSVVTYNPEPFADFFDFIIIGDGENVLNEIVKVYKKNKNLTRNEILKCLTGIKGIYVPSLMTPVYSSKETTFLPINFEVQKRLSDLKKCLYSPIIAEQAFYQDSLFIEVSRGCPNKCKFCIAGACAQPYRYPSFESIKKAIKKGYGHVSKIVLIGAMITSHPQFNDICEVLRKIKTKKNIEVEFSSLSSNEVFENAVELLSDENKEISIAIESGSKRLRDYIGKELSDETLLNVLAKYNELGVKKVNIYTMIGLPSEEKEDIDEFLNLALKLKKSFSEIEFNYIISSFIAKAGTPFENEKRENNASLKHKLEVIKNCFDSNEIKAKYPVLKSEFANALISKGDRRLCAFLKYVFDKNIQIKDWAKVYKKVHNKLGIPHYTEYVYKKKENKKTAWSFIKND